MSEPRIVFMGTPEFAVATLEALLEAGKNVVGVVTAPDRPAGRGLKLTTSAVKDFACSHQLPLLQPEKLKAPEFLAALADWKADLQVVVAFRMLPELVWRMPPLGTINVHASLLPAYRGAAPINWAIINGEKQTGITTFRLARDIDTGDILCQEAIEIGKDETAGELHDRLKALGAQLAVRTVDGLASGTLIARPQSTLMSADRIQATHAPKIFTDTCRIDWSLSTQRVYDLIRGLSPYPAAFTTLEGKQVKIFRASMVSGEPGGPPGGSSTDGRSWLRFACADGSVAAMEVQVEGKKRMPVEEFLKGFRSR